MILTLLFCSSQKAWCVVVLCGDILVSLRIQNRNVGAIPFLGHTWILRIYDIYYCSKKNSPFGILMFITWFQLQIMFFFCAGIGNFHIAFTIFHMFLLGDVTPRGLFHVLPWRRVGQRRVSSVLDRTNWWWTDFVFPPRMAMSGFACCFLFVSVFCLFLYLFLFVCLFVFCCFLISFFLCILSGGCTYHLPKHQ